MKNIVLCIMDGVGIREEKKGNAFKLANTPNFDYLWNNYPHCMLEASGEFVGLPKGQMGNSEVGHLNIGTGRVVYQPLQMINNAIEDGSFYKNDKILNLISKVKKNDRKLHIMGLISDGGVHSELLHLLALIKLCKEQDIEPYLHLFTDGRDTPPDSALKYFDELDKLNYGKISTISGRFYAMDRDNRWERIKKAYDAIVNGKGDRFSSYKEAIETNYSKQITDEFIVPAIIDDKGLVSSGDGVIVFNYRTDRQRELFKALTNKNFNEFETTVDNIDLVTMVPVSEEVIHTPAFSSSNLVNTLGSYISEKGYSQLRIAETEKYAHVTFFFDGQVDVVLKGSNRILVPSPKVETYDLAPKMSACEITDKLLPIVNDYNLIVLNFANGDMLGHTGVLEAAIEGVETVDQCLGKIFKACNGTIIVTADHGNCEEMIGNDGSVITSHTTNKVPFIITDKTVKLDPNKVGKLSDIAPTILKLMDISVPKEMTGDILIK